MAGVTAALFEDGGMRIIPGHTALDVILDPSLVRPRSSASLDERRAHYPHPSAGSVGLRLHL